MLILKRITLFVILGLSLDAYCQTKTQAIMPLPYAESPNSQKVQLGKALFYDKLFSKTQDKACASCHDVRTGGANPKNMSGTFNIPTVLNSSLNFRQFWNGRAKTLKEVINDHLADKSVFDNNWDTILGRLNHQKKYVDKFQAVYKKNPTQENTTDALVSYLNNLITPLSDFDKYLRGDENALSPEAKKGYQLFISYGCITCHQGINMGGNLYEKLGVYQDYFAKKGSWSQIDLGYYNVTKNENDKYVFKVPSLRNVALTAPYFHDGSIKTLEEAVQLMGIYQAGQPIPNYDVAPIVKFLQSLTGKLDSALIEKTKP